MPAANLSEARRRLLRWYERHRRDLPWRRTRDPYAIWVSETMLQQTQVSTVIPYYQRFMRAFPTIAALDRAPLAKVLALWSGLGYYRRVENLKRSARILTERHCGRLPADYTTLRQLPGIGAYTAGALLSIAFGAAYPALDGNARRVLARLFLLSDEPKLREMAGRLISRSKPGQFNQSLMELGSEICTPINPTCGLCPLATLCAARKNQQATQFPPSKKGPETRAVVWPLAIVRSDGKLLLHQRGPGGVLAGLWELPGGEKKHSLTIETLVKECLLELHDTPLQMLPLGEITHSITNRRIRAPVFLIEWPSAAAVGFNCARWRWVAPAGLYRQPTSAMTRKAIKLLSVYENNLL